MGSLPIPPRVPDKVVHVTDESRLLGDRYRVGKLIGRGGMGDVYLGTDTRLGRTVAIKILRSQLTEDEDFRRRFRQEARAAARMNHPNIVRTYDTGEDVRVESGAESILPYIVMEYVEGRTVKDLIRSGSLTVSDSVRIISDVLAALDYAHSAGFVHRDIKPANVMVSVSGFVKVMDFGVAKAVADSSATVAMTAHVLGTATYFSPEQAKGDSVDGRSDLYSAGVMLYEMLTGVPPFQGDSPTSIAYQHVNTPPTPPIELNPEVPEALSQVVMAALAKNPDNRYPTARDFSQDVVAAAAGRTPVHLMHLSDAAAPTTVLQTQPAAGDLDFDSLLSDIASTPNNTPAPAQETPEPASPTRPRVPWPLVIAAAVLTVATLFWLIFLAVTSGRTNEYMATIPDVTSQSSSAAQAALEAAGFTVTVEQDTSADIEENLVISTDPEAGSSVAKGSDVTMIVSLGPEQVEVPSLTGLSLDSAKERLTQLGLTVGEVTTQDSATYAENIVLESDPAGTTSIDAGSTVNLVVSSGKVTLPDVTGSSITDARQQLEDLGLQVLAEPVYNCSGTADEVVRQTPTAGKITGSTTVTLAYTVVDSGRCSVDTEDTSGDSDTSQQ